jgi:hypothetical protein
LEAVADALGVHAEPIGDPREGPAIVVQADGFFDLGVGEATGAPGDASSFKALGEGSAVGSERGRDLVERETGLIGSDDRVHLVVVEANLDLSVDAG